MTERNETRGREHCPKCGRFVRVVRFTPYLDEFGGTLTVDCKRDGVKRIGT